MVVAYVMCGITWKETPVTVSPEDTIRQQGLTGPRRKETVRHWGLKDVGSDYFRFNQQMINIII